MKVNIWWVLMALLIAGCSAKKQLKPEASAVQIFLYKPDTAQCKYLGEIIGSPGSWGVEDYRSNEALMIGASNDLRNQAYDMGGNTIYLNKINDVSSWVLLGTTSISLTGLVYHCK